MNEFGPSPEYPERLGLRASPTDNTARERSFETGPEETFIVPGGPPPETPDAGAYSEAYDADQSETPEQPAPIPHEDIIADNNLAELITNASQKIGPEAVDRILTVNKRFCYPDAGSVYDTSDPSYDKHLTHRDLLAELPTYSDVATASDIPPEAAEELLVHTLNGALYPTASSPDGFVRALTRAIRPPGTEAAPVTPEQLSALKTFITAASEYSVIDTGLIAVRHARKAGLSLEDSMQIVADHINNSNFRTASYDLPPMHRMLNAFNAAQADPAFLKEVMSAMAQLDDPTRRQMYDGLRQTVTIVCPTQNVTAAELLEHISAELQIGQTGDRALLSVVDKIIGRHETAEPTPALTTRAERIERRFISKPGSLEHAVVPYRTERGLNDGLRDMEQLVRAGLEGDATISEGGWVYDPDSSTWYSLGGETEYLGASRVRHTHYVPYDPDELSARPMAFHLHPNAFSVTGPAIDPGFIFPSDADLKYIADKKGDAPLRSFITHEYGVTEVVYPEDVNAIRYMSTVFTGITQRIFDNAYTTDRDMQAHARNAGADTVAQLLAQDVNAVLETDQHIPRGFYIKLHPPGVDLEAILAQEQREH